MSRPEDVLAKFLCSLPDMDKEACQGALSHYESVDEDDLLEVLSTYNTRVMPHKENIGLVLKEVAQHELIQRTAFITECWGPRLQKRLWPLIPEGACQN